MWLFSREGYLLYIVIGGLLGIKKKCFLDLMGFLEDMIMILLIKFEY